MQDKQMCSEITRQPELILASASPRRQELLGKIGLEFEVVPADIDEEALHKGVPEEDAPRAAMAKARAVAGLFSEGLVLGADTMVVLDGVIFGKPADREQARQFLNTLSGRTHTVYTGVALVEISSGIEESVLETTPVTFRELSEEEIESYLNTADPYDKAGAYGIQSGGRRFIQKLDGDFFNVMGLPVKRVIEMLGRFIDTTGLSVPEVPPHI
jgi:nucleoside triphosphate pyrophosphatase